MSFRKLRTASGVFGGATELRFCLYKERRIKIYVNVSETEPAIELSTRHRVLESPEDAARRRVIEAFPDATFESVGFNFLLWSLQIAKTHARVHQRCPLRRGIVFHPPQIKNHLSYLRHV